MKKKRREARKFLLENTNQQYFLQNFPKKGKLLQNQLGGNGQRKEIPRQTKYFLKLRWNPR
ncbi:MAG: hypothetical protein LBQ12_00385 [Deltaproteobacteria bacterium]|nr:hypothetical protein [Deltaproteobacteria bacterium]